VIRSLPHESPQIGELGFARAFIDLKVEFDALSTQGVSDKEFRAQARIFDAAIG
jgi:hypothetical protein